MKPEIKIENDVELPTRNTWREIAQKMTPGDSVVGLTNDEAKVMSNALRAEGKGARKEDDPKDAKNARVWCMEKLVRKSKSKGKGMKAESGS